MLLRAYPSKIIPINGLTGTPKGFIDYDTVILLNMLKIDDRLSPPICGNMHHE